MNGPDGKHDSKLAGAGRLVGGYASKNLSEQEKQALFDAALHDQQLFDALMEEQALQDLLEEPGVKPELIQALQHKATLLDRFQKWIKTPMAWGAAGAVATAAVLLVVVMPPRTQQKSVAMVATSRQATGEQAKPAQEREQVMQRAQTEPSPTAAPKPQPLRERKQTLQDSVAPAPPPQSVDPVRQVAQEPAPPVVALQKSDGPAGERRDEKREQTAARLSEQSTAQPATAVRSPMVAAPAAAFGVMSAPALSVDYTLLRRNAEGTFEPATSVRATDAVRLQVTPSHAGYLYLYRREANGGNTTVVGAQRVTARQAVVVPSQGALAAGNQQYLLTFARDPNPPAAPAVGAIDGQSFSKMKRAAEADAAASSVRSVPSSPAPNQKANLPAASASRVTASPVDPNTVAIEITIRPEEN